MTEEDIQRPPGKLEHLFIPEYVLRNTITGLSYGAGREMLCYWLGFEVRTASGVACGVVSTVVFPKIESSYAHFRLLEGQMGLITTWCASHGAWLLSQVHTHPTDEEHSEADECWPASHRRGFLSIVIPYFATLSSVRNPGWRAYESLGNGDWVEVAPEERLKIVPDVLFP